MNILICGEAWGKVEEEQGRPFVGSSGYLLNQMLAIAGIAREDCYVTNVLNLRPKPNNDIKNCCGPKAAGIPGMPAISAGKYLRNEFKPELDRLYSEVEQYKPNLIIAFGATAAWAFLRTSGIAKVRGATAPSVGLSRPFKILPTYHPAAVMRDWTLRPLVIADLHKARRESAFPDVRRPQRQVWLEPDLHDIDRFFRQHNSEVVCVDIETIGDMITCVGIAVSPQAAIVIPFFDPSKPGKNYWESLEDEAFAWNFVKWVCESKSTVFQNGLYDIHFLWRTIGITVKHPIDDTMLLHHALQPELQKGLGFLGSVYTDEASWKLMRKSVTAKREE